MAQYINKDDIIEKISELPGKLLIDYYRRGEHFAIGDDYKMEAYNEVLSLLNKFKVKKVDLEKEIKDYFNNQPIITRSKGVDYQLIPSNEDIAKHFFELGYGLSHS